MNKIQLNNNILTDEYEFKNNILTIRKSGTYFLEYSNNINNYEIIFNSNLNINVLEISNERNLNNRIKYIVLGGSNINICKFYNNQTTEETIDINLVEENNLINYNLSCLSSNVDNFNIVVNHNKSNTKSNVNNKILSLNDNKCVVNIDSNVKNDLKKCELIQNSKAVILDNGSTKINPNMFIDSDDIVAKHSASIGKFGEDAIFYLLSRGIDEKTAIELLSKSFIMSNFIFEQEKVLEIINKYWR